MSMSNATTRITIVTYIDDDLEQKQLEFPGWGNSLQGIIDSNVAPSLLLGQLWVERPYRTLAEAPDHFTAVDLRSADGMQRMVQEFAGHITDKAKILELVLRRLGDEMSKWTV